MIVDTLLCAHQILYNIMFYLLKLKNPVIQFENRTTEESRINDNSALL